MNKDEGHIVDRCDFNVGECIGHRYRVVRTLGEGSFGKVYKVTDGTGEEYALKLLRLWEVSPEIRKPLMERFEMEFKAGQIDCDNLVRSLDYGTTGGNPYIVMEYCPGGDLIPYLGSGSGRIPQICQQILFGLHALHTRGKVHRDLKPENVLFKSNGMAALTDFGIAGDRNRRMTERNLLGKPTQVFGTYAYMPPEQINRTRGGATVLPTTDVFSFGVLAFQLLTGKLPFGQLNNHNELACYQQRLKKGEWDWQLLSQVPAGDRWKEVLAGCLKPNFKDRFQSAEEVLKHIPGSTLSPGSWIGTPVNAASGFALQVLQGEEAGRVYPLSELFDRGKRIVTIGRAMDNVIVIKEEHSAYISRHHCCIETNSAGDCWIVRDGQWIKEKRVWQQSGNGTFVNSTQVDKQGCLLKAGDLLSIGDVKLRFEKH